MNQPFIPVCEPFLNGNEKKYVLDALETGWISSSGEYIAAFEHAFAQYCGVKHGVAVCNGTVALHLALVALGVDRGDEVIIPDFTMIASAFAVCYTGAMPVFIDAEPETWNMNTARIEEKITGKTKAIMAVHIYGHPCDMQPIWDIAEKHNLKVVEDAAEVHGAEYKGKKCGSLSDIATFSFFANKIATTGEGGMVITNDDELADRCRYHKNLCFPLKGQRIHRHDDIGFNYRMSNIHAALGLAQVEKLDEYIAMRRKNHSLYAELLKDVPGIYFQPEKPWAKNVYWMNGITVDKKEFGLTRDVLMEKLKEKKIDTRFFFMGMHTQPALRSYGCDTRGEFPVSNNLAANGLYLPSGSSLRDSEIEYICSTIKAMHI